MMKKTLITVLTGCSIMALAKNTPTPEKTYDTERIFHADEQAEKMNDTEAILAVIDTYIEGLRTGRVDLLKKCFHKDATMYGYSVENKITEGSVDHLYDLIAKHGALAKVTSKNSVLHQTSNTASVLAELKTTALHENSTDYLSLMKINGEWKIISKVYHLSYAN
ncbi:nuclear transport factor 2 family protein [Flavobacterium aquidurense]|uniref:nuclear transport factor 2 family protein n=1 Tax=Flavobacterium aquidurense TaxID=362413 RepID=UPI00375716BF